MSCSPTADLTALLSHMRHSDVSARYAGGFRLAEIRAQHARFAAARLGLEKDLESVAREMRVGRLQAYRNYVGETVATISPLLLRVCADQGLDLDELVHRLAPDRFWVSWLCGPRPIEPGARVKGKVNLHRANPEDERCFGLQSFAHSGVVIQKKDEALPFGIRVLFGGLEVAAFLGTARLRTYGDFGHVALPDELPENLFHGLAGQPLDALLQHRLLDGAGAVIARVERNDPWGVKVLFHLAATPWRMPWTRTTDRAGVRFAEPTLVASPQDYFR